MDGCLHCYVAGSRRGNRIVTRGRPTARFHRSKDPKLSAENWKHTGYWHNAPPFRELPPGMQKSYRTYERDKAIFYLWKVRRVTFRRLADEGILSFEGIRRCVKRYAKKIREANRLGKAISEGIKKSKEKRGKLDTKPL